MSDVGYMSIVSENPYINKMKPILSVLNEVLPTIVIPSIEFDDYKNEFYITGWNRDYIINACRILYMHGYTGTIELSEHNAIKDLFTIKTSLIYAFFSENDIKEFYVKFNYSIPLSKVKE